MPDGVFVNAGDIICSNDKELVGSVPVMPFLPVVHAVAVGINEIRRAVGGQTVLLRPGVGENRAGRLKFIRAHVHRAAGDARVAIQICST